MSQVNWRKILCMVLVLLASGRMWLPAYTVTYTVTITTTSNSPSQNSDGTWNTANGGTTTFDNGEDPHDPSSYNDRGGIPTTTSSHTETRTVEIPGDAPSQKEITAAIQQETDKILEETKQNAQNNSDKGGKNKTAGEDLIRVTARVTDRNNGMSRIIAQSDNSEEAGDPVLVSSGQYVQEEKDLTVRIGGLSVELGRRYRLDKELGDSLGSAWIPLPGLPPHRKRRHSASDRCRIRRARRFGLLPAAMNCFCPIWVPSPPARSAHFGCLCIDLMPIKDV